MASIDDFIKSYITIDKKRYRFSGEITVLDTGNRFNILNTNGSRTPIIQYLGKKERRFSINIEFYGSLDDIENSYLRQKSELRNWLESKRGLSTEIIFPDGEIVRASVLDYREAVSQKNRCVVSLSFLRLDIVSDIETTQDKSKDKAKEDVKTLNERFLEFVGYEVVNGKVSKDSLNNKFFGIGGKIKTFKDSKFLSNAKRTVSNTKKAIRNSQNRLLNIQEKASFIASSGKRASQFVNSLENSRESIESIITAPADAWNGIKQVYSDLNRFFGNVKSSVDAIYDTYDFSETETQTPANINKFFEQSDESGIKNTFNMAALTSYLEFSLDIDYSNDIEVSDAKAKIEAMYNSAINDPLLSAEVKTDLRNAKLSVSDYLDTLANQVDKITTINIPVETPLSTIVFNYYGNLELYDDIILLNGNTIGDYNKVIGEIKVFNNG